VALTDGIDNTSRRRVEEVIQRALDAKNGANPRGVPLYLLGFGRPGEIDEKVMKHMAERTGGRYFHAKDQQALMDIFEQLSNDLNDDGIDEASLMKLAAATGGKYYPAKDVKELQFILDRVRKTIQTKKYEIQFTSLFQTSDGTGRNVTLTVVSRSNEPGGTQESLAGSAAAYDVPGLVVSEMNPLIYLALLCVLGMLLALPRLWRPAGGSG
jgi:hypothetical protein